MEGVVQVPVEIRRRTQLLVLCMDKQNKKVLDY